MTSSVPVASASARKGTERPDNSAKEVGLSPKL